MKIPGTNLRWMKRGGWTVLALVAVTATALVVGCKMTFLRLAPLPREIVEKRDIVYRAGSTNPKHRLDVFAPKDARGAPVVHFVHGGYWVGGDKDYKAWITRLYGSIGRTLAARGIVTVVQSYRLVPEVSFDDLVDDVMAGLRWTEQHAAEYGGDSSRVFMMGHSAGGHLVALAGVDGSLHTRRGMDPAAVRGYIAISAVWDVENMHDTQDAAFQERVTYPVFGHAPAIWVAASPIAKLCQSPDAKPNRFLLMIGEKDYPYLIPQAEKAKGRLTELGAEPTWYVAKGNDHDAMVLEFGARDDNVTQPVIDFIDRIR